MTEGAKILVVDDESAICELCARSLLRYGYGVVSTTSPLQAVEMMRQQEFDLLLLDVRMPEMDGLEVMRRVREFAPDVAIVVMTGYASVEAAIEAVKQGAADFLPKPFQLDNLRLAVSGALARRELFEERARSQALMNLVRVSEKLASSLETDVLIHVALRAAMAETSAHRGSVMLYEPEEEMLRLAEGVGLPEELRAGYTTGTMDGVAGYVLKQGEALLVEDVRQDTRLEELPRPNQERYSSYSFLSVPIRSGDRIQGVLNLTEKVGGIPFLKSDLEVSGLLCSQLAIALERVGLFSEIQESYERLQEVDRLKSEFLNIAAHELRTPLSVILGYAMMLREQLAGPTKEHMDAIVESAFNLSRLVEDMTNLRYLEVGAVPLNTLELQLRELVLGVVDHFRQLADNKRLEIVVDVEEDLPQVQGDAEKVELILGNLLSNATKFTPPAGTIRIGAVPTEQEVVISVTDTGRGIPREECDRIFEPFYQVEDSLTREHSGMGLGLSIAREVVLLHRGRIWVESEPGQGSTFFFTLPRADVGQN